MISTAECRCAAARAAARANDLCVVRRAVQAGRGRAARSTRPGPLARPRLSPAPCQVPPALAPTASPPPRTPHNPNRCNPQTPKQDWKYVAAGAMELTLEISNDKFVPASQLAQIWADNKEALIQLPITAALGGAPPAHLCVVCDSLQPRAARAARALRRAAGAAARGAPTRLQLLPRPSRRPPARLPKTPRRPRPRHVGEGRAHRRHAHRRSRDKRENDHRPGALLLEPDNRVLLAPARAGKLHNYRVGTGLRQPGRQGRGAGRQRRSGRRAQHHAQGDLVGRQAGAPLRQADEVRRAERGLRCCAVVPLDEGRGGKVCRAPVAAARACWAGMQAPANPLGHRSHGRAARLTPLPQAPTIDQTWLRANDEDDTHMDSTPACVPAHNCAARQPKSPLRDGTRPALLAGAAPGRARS